MPAELDTKEGKLRRLFNNVLSPLCTDVLDSRVRRSATGERWHFGGRDAQGTRGMTGEGDGSVPLEVLRALCVPFPLSRPLLSPSVPGCHLLRL